MIWALPDGAVGGWNLPTSDLSASESAPDRADVADALPPEFLALPERLPPYLDRSLGYVGADRFVIFYYEPRGEEVVWEDGHTYGFGAGGWCAFEDLVAPLAKRHGADLGNEKSAGRDVLVLDRQRGLTYFAERGCARLFVRGLTGTGAGMEVVPGLASTDVDVGVHDVAVDVFGRLDVDRTCS
jgi:hypothetical protein